MPYIAPTIRSSLDREERKPEVAGELCYAIVKLCNEYLNHGRKEGRVSFGRLSEVVASLECTKLEFYRRMVARLEDLRRHENGDVFDVR